MRPQTISETAEGRAEPEPRPQAGPVCASTDQRRRPLHPRAPRHYLGPVVLCIQPLVESAVEGYRPHELQFSDISELMGEEWEAKCILSTDSRLLDSTRHLPP